MKLGTVFRVLSMSCAGSFFVLLLVGFSLSSDSPYVEAVVVTMLLSAFLSVFFAGIAILLHKPGTLRRAIGVTMVVSSVILALAIAIPNLMESKRQPSRSAVVIMLHRIYLAQKKHFGEHGRYATLRELHEAQLLDERAASGKASGYLWEMNSFGSESWSVVAWPEQPRITGDTSFYVDQTGVLRFKVHERENEPLPDSNSQSADDFTKQPEKWAY